jgi:hypothetical protein
MGVREEKLLARLIHDEFTGLRPQSTPNKNQIPLLAGDAEIPPPAIARKIFRKPRSKQLVRYQSADLNQVNEILRHGFFSRARANRIPGIQEIEAAIASDKNTFRVFGKIQKGWFGQTFGDFPAVFVETSSSSNSIRWMARHQTDQLKDMVWIKLKPDHAVSVSDYVKPGDPEKGHYFLGRAMPDDFLDVIWFDSRGTLQRGFRDPGSGQWELRGTEQSRRTELLVEFMAGLGIR